MALNKTLGRWGKGLLYLKSRKRCLAKLWLPACCGILMFGLLWAGIPATGHASNGQNPPQKDYYPNFSKNELKRAGFIVPMTGAEGSITGNPRDRLVVGSGDIVYIDIGFETGVKKGDLFTVFSQKRFIEHPVIRGSVFDKRPPRQRKMGEADANYLTPRGKPLGYLVRILGYLEVIEPGDGVSRAIIRESYGPISMDTRIFPYREQEVPKINFGPPKPREGLEGYIVTFQRQRFTGAQLDLVYIDKGYEENVAAGDLFEVYTYPPQLEQARWYDGPSGGVAPMPEVVGELQVIATQKETSTAVVRKSSMDLKPGYPIRFKPMPPPPPPVVEAPPPPPEPVEVVEPEPPVVEEEPFMAMEEPEPVEEARLLPFEPSLVLQDIHFQFDKHDLDDRSRESLKKIAQYLDENPGVRIEIEGHCDERGTNNYNLALGDRRANAAKSFLTSLGVDPDRLRVISYGEEAPLCTESNENCWWKNRRAHFVVRKSEVN